MKIVDPGHTYDLKELGSDDHQRLTFIKRSGKTIKHDTEHPGVQTQEVLRSLIDRSIYLNSLIPCNETQDAIYHLRMALFMYEARAYRRKVQEHNRQDSQHFDEERARPWRENDFSDVPFTEFEIEDLPVCEDGHVIPPYMEIS